MTQQRRRDERGTSAIELVLYMPLLMIAILLTVQFALVYLGNQAVSAAAREAGRTARVTGDTVAAEARGASYASTVGGGLIDDIDVQVVQVGDDEMRATVTAHAVRLLPFLGVTDLSEEVQGPIEQFQEDAP
ncbi:TadE-like protein [Mumia flava]|uniref:TadE-like protein n=1 Tax=Mumia flava TaxID=1348852 RepID=A0A0B2B8L2_9ACTN|nr:TadE/TadG family type IV pilus assembly protein [Mumia flava]PJJ53572.1 TadE-like protein [Mumia flava]